VRVFGAERQEDVERAFDDRERRDLYAGEGHWINGSIQSAIS
jgi:hypothetical protein